VDSQVHTFFEEKGEPHGKNKKRGGGGIAPLNAAVQKTQVLREGQLFKKGVVNPFIENTSVGRLVLGGRPERERVFNKKPEKGKGPQDGEGANEHTILWGKTF